MSPSQTEIAAACAVVDSQVGQEGGQPSRGSQEAVTSPGQNIHNIHPCSDYAQYPPLLRV